MSIHILELSPVAKSTLQKERTINAPSFSWIKNPYTFVYLSVNDHIEGYAEIIRHKSGYCTLENAEWYYGRTPDITTKTLQNGTLVSPDPLVLISGTEATFRKFVKQIPDSWVLTIDAGKYIAFDQETGESRTIVGAYASDIRCFIAAGYLTPSPESEEGYEIYIVKHPEKK